jgi:hypothetical protein
MHSRARRIIPALVLASVLPLSLSACEGNDKAGGSSSAGSSGDSKPADSSGKGDKDGDGTGADKPADEPGADEGGSDVGPCDDKTQMSASLGAGTEGNDKGSFDITILNTGSKPCILPEVLDLSLFDEDDAPIDVTVETTNDGSEAALAPDGTVSASLEYTVDPEASPVAGGELDLDGIGKLAVDREKGSVSMSSGTAELSAFKTD